MEVTDNNIRQMKYEEVLAQYGECITHVTGWSMEPLLHNRQSIVRVVPVEKEQLKVGDVVLYKVDEQYILHRIMRIQGDVLITRGDNNWFLERISADHVLGKMTGYWRKPDKKFEECNNWIYQFYYKGLPIWRTVRMITAKMKRLHRKCGEILKKYNIISF